MQESGRLVRFDPLSMPRRRKGKERIENTGLAKNGSGGTVCALCGRSMRSGNASEPVIYSICASCKRLPHRNPGSNASLC
jgi:hypothetical protein